jgi:hypothetical protein
VSLQSTIPCAEAGFRQGNVITTDA